MAAGALSTTDVVVVGAGIVGLCSAWELRRRGLDVAIVDQQFPAFGATGRNPGTLWLQTRRAGVELELARFGKAKLGEYAEEHGDVFDFRERGGLFFFETEEQGRILEAYAADRSANGLTVEMIDRRTALEHAPILPDTAIGAVYCAEDAQIDAQDFARMLFAACIRAGVQVYEQTPVLSTLRRGGRAIGVRTLRGDIHAGGVVWATGAWAVQLRGGGIATPVSTVRVGQLVTQPVDAGRSAPLHGPRGVYGTGALTDLAAFDPEHFGAPQHDDSAAAVPAYDDCIAQNRGGSLYVGHSLDGRGSLDAHISLRSSAAMIETAIARFGHYADFGVTGLWAGLGSETPDYLPIVGAQDGVHLNVGHAWGISSGPACGQIIAEIVVGETTRFSVPLSPARATLAPATGER